MKMDNVSIDAEKKKDHLEADVAEHTLVMPDLDKALIVTDAKWEMERELCRDESENKAEDLSPPVSLKSSAANIDCQIDTDYLEELDTDKSSRSCTLPQPNSADSHSITARNMNPELLKAVKGGNIAFIKDKARDLECSSLLETSPKLNTILHVATSSGHEELVKVILETKWCEELVTRMNSTDNLALHVAASVGHLPIVKLLLSSYKQPEESRNSFGQLRMQNKEGNTPLHMALIKKYEEVALKSKYSEVASFLVEKDPEGSIFPINNEGKSPVYLVAEAGDAELLKFIMDKFTCPAYINGKSIVLAAIYGACTCKNIGNFLASQTPFSSSSFPLIQVRAKDWNLSYFYEYSHKAFGKHEIFFNFSVTQYTY